jgi:hypothetical protein
MSSHPYWVTARPRRPCSFLSEKKPRFAECSSTRRCSEEGRFHANFTYQAGSWNKPRRVIAKVAAERMCRACCRTRRPEQWIKEGKGAIKWTRLSCMTFAANARAAPASPHAGAAIELKQKPARRGDPGGPLIDAGDRGIGGADQEPWNLRPT